MNKTQWISIALDGSVDFEEIKGFIDLSFSLVEPKTPKKKSKKQTK